jgi:flagellar biosynthesis protein FliQ
MSPESVMDIGRETMFVIVQLAAPLLLSALGAGLLIGVFQAATQIQEMTLSFIPKLLVIAIALVAAGPWMLSIIMEFTQRLYADIPAIVG